MNILEVGCGIGSNLEFLISKGYNNVSGTDISDKMLDISRKKNLNVKPASQIFNEDLKYDILLISHVIEHMEFEKLQTFLDSYFSLLSDNGMVIIITPLLTDRFYTDIDHVKPYNIDALLRLYCESEDFSRSYYPNYTIQLINIYFRRERYDILNSRIRYFDNIWNKTVYTFIKIFFMTLKIISFGIMSRATGYTAILKVSKF
jgi:cyclopropane fatty-acyl-phospholipid synthase-like methyltransferase